MKSKIRFLLCIAILFGLSNLAVIPLTHNPTPMSAEDLIESRIADILADFTFDSGPKDETEVMKRVVEQIEPREIALASSTPFTYLNTFDFTNTNWTFGEHVMTEEEVEENLRNFMFQLMYSDIEVACEVSVLDVLIIQQLDSLLLDALDMDFMGFCSGMAQASRELFNNPDLTPLGFDYAKELPSPYWNDTLEDENGDVVESFIKSYVFWKGSAAFFNPWHLMTWLKNYFGLTSTVGGSTNAEEFLELAEAMLLGTHHYEPQVILLSSPWWEEGDAGQSHFVLAHDYERNSNDSITIYIYNNNYLYDDDSALYDHWVLLESDGSLKSNNSGLGGDWTRMIWYPPGTDGINGAFRILEEVGSLITDLIDTIMAFVALSPVDVEITDPLGRTVSVNDDGEVDVNFPAIATESNGHKKILAPYMPGLDYNVKFTGTDVGNYTFEVHRAVDGQLVTEVFEGSTVPGQVDNFIVRTTDNGTILAAEGVHLYDASILSGIAVELNWTEYDETNFDRYEIYVSDSLTSLGTLWTTVEDETQTRAIISGLTPKTTYFFTVRVVTDNEDIADSNRVGAAMPEDINWLLYGALGAAGFAILLVMVLICRRRRS
jgi:hypothetical protein